MLPWARDDPWCRRSRPPAESRGLAPLSGHPSGQPRSPDISIPTSAHFLDSRRADGKLVLHDVPRTDDLLPQKGGLPRGHFSMQRGVTIYNSTSHAFGSSSTNVSTLQRRTAHKKRGGHGTAKRQRNDTMGAVQRPLIPVKREELYTDLEARIRYLHSFVDFSSRTSATFAQITCMAG